MSNVTVNIGTYCNVTASYDGITLSVTAEVLPAVIQQQTDWNETNTDAASYLKNKPTIDDTVTETSQNAVKSSGIWTWAKGLFTPKDPTETEADTLTDESVFQFWKGEHKKITWANIKATLKTYFDTIYSTFSGSYNDLSHKPTIPNNADQITVSDPVTPDYTPAEQGDNMQDITNKVAGLQFTKIVEINLSEDVTQIIETFDRNYNELIIYTEFTFKDINNDPLDSRARYTFNNVNDNIYSWGTNLDFSSFRTLNANTNKEVAIIHVKANVNNNFVGTTISAREAMSIYGVGFNSFSSIQINAIATFISNNSKLTIYGR